MSCAYLIRKATSGAKVARISSVLRPGETGLVVICNSNGRQINSSRMNAFDFLGGENVVVLDSAV